VYWLSPFSWAFRAAAINEFLSDDPSWTQDSGAVAPECLAFPTGGNCTVGEVVSAAHNRDRRIACVLTDR
jgi:hypothetical protein